MAAGSPGAGTSAGVIERHSIDHVPTTERHGKAWHQGPFWFTGAFVLPSMLVGFSGPALGLAPLWSVIAVVVGMALGTAFMALHANQGPRLGLPQMIQSRAQFGSMGAAIPLLVAVFIYLGFNVFQFIVTAEAVQVFLPGSANFWIVICAVLAVLFSLVGHDFLHVFQRWSSYLTMLVFAILSVFVIVHYLLSSGEHASTHGFTLAAFMVQLTAATGYQISYAIYVSDYTRYLPESTPARSVIGWTFWGGFVGAAWPAALGTIIACYTTIDDPVVAVHSTGNMIFSGFGVIAVVCSLPALLGTSGVNSYGAMLSGLSIVDGFRSISPTVRVRFIGVVAAGVVSALIAILLPANLQANFNTFLAVLAYLIIPWSAVNLADFYLVRKGHYSIADILDRDGRYGRIGWRGMTAFLVGLATMVPFMSLSFYTGPVPSAIGGADLSFWVGLIVAGGLYLLLSRNAVREDIPARALTADAFS
jgi:NCS1 family nucleobase:cation symporter-1